MADKIRVCEDCGVPLIWTFCWAYKEYFCINCGGHWDMFGGEDVDATPELKRLSRKLNKLWKVIYTQLIPRSNYSRSDCKKCKTEDNHRLHLTRREKIKNYAATKIFTAMEGLFA